MGLLASLTRIISCLAFIHAILVSPAPVEPGPEYVYEKELEDVSLECPVQPDEWSRPHDGPLPPNHQTHDRLLNLPKIFRNSSGKYVCYSSGIKRKEFIVVVEFSPEITFKPARLHDGSHSQNDVKILCSAYASPAANPMFLLNGEVLTNNCKFKISAYPLTQFLMENELLVSRDSIGDKDIIECQAINKRGSEKKTVPVPTEDKHTTPIQNKQYSVAEIVAIVLGVVLGVIIIYRLIKNRHWFAPCRSSQGLDGLPGPQQVVPDGSYGTSGGPDPLGKFKKPRKKNFSLFQKGSPGTGEQAIGPARTAKHQVDPVSFRNMNESAL